MAMNEHVLSEPLSVGVSMTFHLMFVHIISSPKPKAHTLSQIANRPLTSSKNISVNQKEATIMPISWLSSIYH